MEENGQSIERDEHVSLFVNEGTNDVASEKFDPADGKIICVRVKNDQEPIEVLSHLFNVEKLIKPSLILTVIGSGNELNLRLRDEIKKALSKILSNTFSWIITDCNNESKIPVLINEAIFEGCNAESVPFIRINSLETAQLETNEIPFQIVSLDMRQKIAKASQASVNTNEINKIFFIAIEHGTVKIGQFLNTFQMQLRRNLPYGYYSSKVLCDATDVEYEIPAILIVVNGDLETLNSIYYSLQHDVSVLLVAGTEGMCELIVNIINLVQENRNEDESIELSIRESEEFKDIYNDAKMKLKFVLEKYNQSKLVNIYEYKESGEAFQSAILKALINKLDSWKNPYKNLKYILGIDGFQGFDKKILKLLKKLEHKQLENLVEIALLGNNHEFIDIMSNFEKFDWNKFLTQKRLYILYNLDKVLENKKTNPFLPDTDNPLTFKMILKFLKKHTFKEFETKLLPKDIEETKIKKIISYATKKRARDGEVDEFFPTGCVEHPFQNLFIWSIVFQKFEMSKIFWIKGENQISSALFASKFLSSISKEADPDVRQKVEFYSKEFEKLAISVMNVFDQNTHNFMNSILLIKKTSFSSNVDNLQMAVECECRNFVAQQTVQTFLTDIWYGRINQNHKIFKYLPQGLVMIFVILLGGFFGPLFIEDPKKPKLSKQEQYVFDRTKIIKGRLHIYKSILNPYVKEKMDRMCSKYWYKYVLFFRSAYVHFMLNLIFSVIFIFLFSWMMLYKFNHHYVKASEIAEIMGEFNESNFTQETTTPVRILTGPMKEKSTRWLYILLYVWVTGLLVEEIRQISIQPFKTKSKTIRQKLNSYRKNKWNYCDLSGIFFFIVGMTIRLFCTNDESIWYFIARAILCIDLIIWYWRFLHFLLAHESLGPKLVMIWKMLNDMRFFFIIVLIFVCSFGVFMQATLYPNNNLKFHLMIKRFFHLAFWPIFGELEILEKDLHSKCNNTIATNMEDSNDCLATPSAWLGYLALMGYMLVANVLLINLLIAMFNSTYQQVYENTDSVWKFLRYNLTIEYVEFLSLPPPLNLLFTIPYIIKLLVKYIQKKKKTDEKESKEETESTFEYISSNHQEENKFMLKYYPLTLYEQTFARDCLKELQLQEQKQKEKPKN